MTEQLWIQIIATVYFITLGVGGFYILWSEWQWLRKEEKRFTKERIERDGKN